MKQILSIIIPFVLFVGCSTQPKVLYPKMPKTYLKQSSFSELPRWSDEDYKGALSSFIHSCKSKKTQQIYKNLCKDASQTLDAQNFFQTNFDVFKIYKKDASDEGLLTGYYEPNLRGSLVKKEPYIYPVYAQPRDLISVDLKSIYPELKKYRLRGRLKGDKLIPYYTREQISKNKLDAEILCYVDSKIDLFFLEVQGSGRVTLDNNKSIFIGYANQNGHRYKSIGRYLVKNGEIALKDISLQSIRKWLNEHPSRIDEVLNYNKSAVFFKKKKNPASGSLGLVLTPYRSVAVDRSFIPLGSMLYLSSKVDAQNIDRVVMAEDTGGAIKGAIRADMFFGFNQEAQRLAGELKSPLKLWIFLPKVKR
jgi:membrane-bound lytic murein transglycosylase A